MAVCRYTSVRRYAKMNGGVYVMTGPYFNPDDRPAKILPHYSGKVMLPAGYFKVIATLKQGKIWATAFVFPQNIARSENYCHFIQPMSKVNNVTRGIRIFYQAPVKSLNFQLGC